MPDFIGDSSIFVLTQSYLFQLFWCPFWCPFVSVKNGKLKNGRDIKRVAKLTCRNWRCLAVSKTGLCFRIGGRSSSANVPGSSPWRGPAIWCRTNRGRGKEFTVLSAGRPNGLSRPCATKIGMSCGVQLKKCATFSATKRTGFSRKSSARAASLTGAWPDASAEFFKMTFILV